MQTVRPASGALGLQMVDLQSHHEIGTAVARGLAGLNTRGSYRVKEA